jgi:hypothetical protein
MVHRDNNILPFGQHRIIHCGAEGLNGRIKAIKRVRR